MLVDAAADFWQAQGLVRRDEAGWQLSSSPEALVAAIAPSVRTLIETERTSRLLAEERSLLETASVAGSNFSAIDLADNRDGVEAAERQLELLAETDDSSPVRASAIDPTDRWPRAMPSGTRYITKRSTMGCRQRTGKARTEGSVCGWRPATVMQRVR